MKRSDFKLITDKIIADLNQYDYNYWATREYPLVYEQEVNNLTVQVEIILLELSEIYVHLAVHFFAECYAGIRLPWDRSLNTIPTG